MAEEAINLRPCDSGEPGDPTAPIGSLLSLKTRTEANGCFPAQRGEDTMRPGGGGLSRDTAYFFRVDGNDQRFFFFLGAARPEDGRSPSKKMLRSSTLSSIQGSEAILESSR